MNYGILIQRISSSLMTFICTDLEQFLRITTQEQRRVYGILPFVFKERKKERES